MSASLLRFEDGKISIGNRDILASSASLSLAPSLEIERVYGDYDSSIVGAKTKFVNFAPTQNLKGQLSISFYISAEQFAVGGNPNTIDSIFDIMDGMSESSIDGNIVGRYSFDNMYLKSFGFEMKPFAAIKANATYDIYGSITKTINRRFNQNEVDFAHSLKSFGQVVAGNSFEYDYKLYVEQNLVLLDFYNDPSNTWDYDGDGIQEPVQSQPIEVFGESYWFKNGNQEGIQDPPGASVDEMFEISSLRYNIVVGRKIHNHIRSSENTIVNTSASGVVPVRVSVESIEKSMSIESNEIIEKLNSYGDHQNLTTPFGLGGSRIDAFLLSLSGEKIARFSAAGKIGTQSMSIQQGQYAQGVITIKEVVK